MCVPIVFMPVELMVGRLGWINAGCPDEVERDDYLFGKLVPSLERPVAVCRAEVAYEVVFERLDGTLGRIDAMVRWLFKLPFAVFFLEEGFDWFRTLIVCHVECRLVSFIF